MTNADVPYLAMKDLIDDPINPFTGNVISDEKKRTESMCITDSHDWMVSENDGTTFNTSGGNWWSVRDSIFDMNNWKKVDESEAGK